MKKEPLIARLSSAGVFMLGEDIYYTPPDSKTIHFEMDKINIKGYHFSHKTDEDHYIYEPDK